MQRHDVTLIRPFDLTAVTLTYKGRGRVGTLVSGCRCAISWYDLDLTFELVVVTLTFKILPG